MVNWTTVEDAKLLAGILEFSNIPMNKPLLEFLAKKIGQGCTPKAVSHRLNNIKSRAKGGGSAPAMPKTPRAKSANGAGRGSAPTSSAKRKAVDSNGFGINGNEDAAHATDDDDLGSILSSPSHKKRKVLNSAMKNESTPLLVEEDEDEFQDAQENMIKSEPLDNKQWGSVEYEHFDELDDEYV